MGVAEVHSSFIIETLLGDQVSTHDSLRWAEDEARRLVGTSGKAYKIIQWTQNADRSTTHTLMGVYR